MPADTLSVTDNRTGAEYEIPIAEGSIHATELRKIKVDDEDFGLMSYDPAFLNTARPTKKGPILSMNSAV